MYDQTNEGNEFFKTMVVNKQFTAKVVSKDRAQCVIELRGEDGMSVGDLMVDQGFALYDRAQTQTPAQATNTLYERPQQPAQAAMAHVSKEPGLHPV